MNESLCRYEIYMKVEQTVEQNKNWNFPLMIDGTKSFFLRIIGNLFPWLTEQTHYIRDIELLLFFFLIEKNFGGGFYLLNKIQSCKVISISTWIFRCLELSRHKVEHL